MISLQILRDGRVIREAVFSTLPVTIGRGPDNSVVLTDPSVSRSHARIERPEGGGYRLVDLGSRNGLRVEAQEVAELPVDDEHDAAATPSNAMHTFLPFVSTLRYHSFGASSLLQGCHV